MPWKGLGSFFVCFVERDSLPDRGSVLGVLEFCPKQVIIPIHPREILPKSD